MASPMIKDKIINEINLMPEDKLTEVYRYVHKFRLGEEKGKEEDLIDILSFSGSWKDMDDEVFDDFLSDIASRRNKAFSTRRTNA